ncbi:hypothetical protein FA13DRAFT_1397413 [Coprinellus micaceus]|uniref:Uncharacterized protein n=1 Tax=Coprinellus micaceus TaxID=71717 RepID=A0A4Y7SPJ8_COPMI|nr:hypothetical protein FA13DRAFT_1397413 [Coprinellus micaceus]
MMKSERRRSQVRARGRRRHVCAILLKISLPLGPARASTIRLSFSFSGTRLKRVWEDAAAHPIVSCSVPSLSFLALLFYCMRSRSETGGRLGDEDGRERAGR